MPELAVILNGPPGCGKDTLADLMTNYGFDKHMFKAGLYVETAEYFKVDLDELVRRAADRVLKEQPWDKLEWSTGEPCTPRQALIYTSEKVIKPQRGKQVFGRMAARACEEAKSEFAVFSDGGFVEEIAPLQGVYRKVMVIRLHREGFTFEGDSRAYLNTGDADCTYDMKLEEGAIMEALLQILSLVQQELLPWYRTA